ncbi:MAG: hypothetical protein ACK4N5_19530, partial [Myxococcales bacterium]
RGEDGLVRADGLDVPNLPPGPYTVFLVQIVDDGLRATSELVQLGDEPRTVQFRGSSAAARFPLDEGN